MRLDEFYRQLDLDPPPLILLHGEETCLIEQTVNRVRTVVIGDTRDDFNDHRFNGKSSTAAAIIDAACTYPVFAPRKLVVVHGVDQMPSHEQERMISYLQQPAPETCLLLVAEKIDSRKKFFLEFKKKGAVLKFDPLKNSDLPDFVSRRLQGQGITISRDALDLLCALLNNKLHDIEAELDKLILYIGERQQIQILDVEAIVSRGRTESVFDLGTAIGCGDMVRALTLLRRFATAAEPPLLVLNLITGHFRLLWKIRSLQNRNASVADIARRVGRPPFAIRGLMEQARRFSRHDFINAYRHFVETDLALKSSGRESGALLEHMVIQLIQTKQKPG